MTVTYRLLVRVVLGALLALAVWGTAPGGLAIPGAVSAKQGEPFGTSLYMLEPTYGRTLLPLDSTTLSDYPYLNGVTVGLLSLVPRATQVSGPAIQTSPSGAVLAFVHETCVGCSTPHAKDMTIRLVDAHTGLQLARFHPQVAIGLDYIADDGSRIAGFESIPRTDGVSTWYTLDGKTGRTLAQARLSASDCCGPVIYDQVGGRLYRVGGDDALQLSVTAYDATSGVEQRQVVLSGVLKGSWLTDRQINGTRVSHIASPGVALSPDGKQMAVLDSDLHTLTIVSVPSMRIVSTTSIWRSPGILERIGDFLGIFPTVADAKEIEGTWLQMQFSRDGRSLFVTGMRGSFDSTDHFAYTPLGLQQIDVSTGQVQGTALDGQDIRWLGEAADGSAVYALTTVAKNDTTCPCVLRRLARGSLAVTAERTFKGYAFPEFFVVGGR